VSLTIHGTPASSNRTSTISLKNVVAKMIKPKKQTKCNGKEKILTGWSA